MVDAAKRVPNAAHSGCKNSNLKNLPEATFYHTGSGKFQIKIKKGENVMLEYCVCPKCERMIMLDGDFPSGFCLYCGTHIYYAEAREELLEGLRTVIPDELTLEADLSELIDEDDASEDLYGVSECREESDKAHEYMGKWDFEKAFTAYSRALEWSPRDFESMCGRMTAGILRLKDVERWESYLSDCIALIRSQSDWNMAQKALEYALDIMRKFLSKGGRFVSPHYTSGFFERLTESFPMLRKAACEIFAHCLNVAYAPFTDAARLDHETTRFAVGNYPAEQIKEYRRGMLMVLRYHEDRRVKESLCRALYVYDRTVWLKNRDAARINDAIELCESAADGSFPPEDVKTVIGAMYDFLMMGGLEQNTTPREKRLFLSRVYTYEQIKRMERFFSGYLFFWQLYADIYLVQKKASPISAEYKRMQEKIRRLSP